MMAHHLTKFFLHGDVNDSVRKAFPQAAEQRRRQHEVADGTQAQNQDALREDSGRRWHNPGMNVQIQIVFMCPSFCETNLSSVAGRSRARRPDSTRAGSWQG